MSVRIALVVAATLFVTPALWAVDLMPDFASVPTGWVTDRFQPDSFTNIGAYQGRSNVLGIGISSTDAYGSRPSGYNSTFYNTQGMKYLVSGGAGSSISADLYIPSSWGDAVNGSVRTDMWATMSNGPSVTAYPIIGFTNFGGAARYRIFDGDVVGGWVDMATAVTYDAWTSFSIAFTGTSFDYSINGASVYSDATTGATTGFKEIIMQAYNFGGDPSISGANPVDYTAHWANTPEPGFYGVLALGMTGLAISIRRRRKA